MYNDQTGRTSCKDDCGDGFYITADNTACYEQAPVLPPGGGGGASPDGGDNGDSGDDRGGADSGGGSSVEHIIVKHNIKLDGISATTFNNDIKIINSFIQTVVKLLKVSVDEIKNVRACEIGSTEDSCPAIVPKVRQRRQRQRQRRSLLDENDSCLVRYEIEAKSQEEANKVEQNIQSGNYQSAETFTSELKQSMKTNNVDASVSSSVAATPSATTNQVDSKGSNMMNNNNNKDNDEGKDSAGAVIAAVIITIVVLVGIIGAIVYRNQNQNKEQPSPSQSSLDGLEMVESFQVDEEGRRSRMESVDVTMVTNPSMEANTAIGALDDWEEHKTDEGNTYYSQRSTGLTQWEKPPTTESSQNTSFMHAAPPAPAVSRISSHN